jgi:pyruvate ferredoxin oxidoreductase alpha subunit
MKGELLDSHESAILGARLSRIEFLADHHGSLMANKKLRDFINDLEVMNVKSQSAAVSAAIGAEACGKRAFLFPERIESVKEFAAASHMRLPLVVVSSNTSILRDLGWLIFLPEGNQEILDTVIQAYKVCEDSKVLLPAAVEADFLIRETVYAPSDKAVDRFLPKLKLKHKLDLHNPLILNTEDDFRDQQQKAMQNALKLMDNANEKWKLKFKREYPAVEKYFADSDYMMVISGPDSTTAKSAVNKLREQGENVGLLRLRVLRPFPLDKLETGLKNAKKVAVIDKQVSIGSSGILYSEIGKLAAFSSNFITMKRLDENDIFNAYKRLKESEKEERVWIT